MSVNFCGSFHHIWPVAHPILLPLTVCRCGTFSITIVSAQSSPAHTRSTQLLKVHLTSLIPRLFCEWEQGSHMTSHDITWHHMVSYDITTPHDITWHHMTSHDLCKCDIIEFEFFSTTHLLQPSTSTQFSSCLQWALNNWQCWNWTHPLGSDPTLYRVTDILWWVYSTLGASTSLSLHARGRWVLNFINYLLSVVKCSIAA